MPNLKTFFISYWRGWLVGLAAFIFFLAAGSFNYLTQSPDFIKWLSPDESANYILAKLYGQTGRLDFFEKYNLIAADVMHPRSLRSDLGVLKPMSFLGLPLIYGRIAAIAGAGVLPYLTPLFGALGVIFFYLLIREIFDRDVALLSSLLAAIFPPYLYYSARSMFHNVLFLVLTVTSLYLAIRSVKSSSGRASGPVLAGLAGAALGLAVMTRPSELIWLIPFWLIVYLASAKQAGLIKPLVFLCLAFLAVTPALYYNKILYGSYWRGGYNEMNQSILNLAEASQTIARTGLAQAAVLKSNLTVIKDNFFHFGFKPLASLKMLYYYFARMFYWLFWPAAAGFLLWLTRIKTWRKRHYAYLAAYAAASVILLFYYGSWDFHDNPDPKSFTIGNSYTRYWFLLYFGAMPLAAYFLLRVSSWLKKKPLIYGLRVLAMLAAALVSANLILFGGDEGLVKTAKNQLAARGEFDRVMVLTEARSVIITRYHDKLFFPERKVVVGLFDSPEMIKQYANLVKYLPVYYYNFTFPAKDMNFLNTVQLPPFGLKIAPVEKVTKDFTLYKLSAK